MCIALGSAWRMGAIRTFLAVTDLDLLSCTWEAQCPRAYLKAAESGEIVCVEGVNSEGEAFSRCHYRWLWGAHSPGVFILQQQNCIPRKMGAPQIVIIEPLSAFSLPLWLVVHRPVGLEGHYSVGVDEPAACADRAPK